MIFVILFSEVGVYRQGLGSTPMKLISFGLWGDFSYLLIVNSNQLIVSLLWSELSSGMLGKG